MKRALFITLNEVKLYLQDKGDLAVSLLLPIVTFALIYGAFGGSTLFTATTRVVNEDAGIYSAQLIERLDKVDGIEVEMLTASAADEKLDKSDLTFVLFIPAGFSEALANGQKAEVVFKQRGNGGQDGQILASIIRGAAEEMNTIFRVNSQVRSNLQGTGVPEANIDTTVQQLLAEEQQKPSLGVTEEIVGGSADIANQYLPGIVTMYVLFTLNLGAVAIVQERRKGTLERLLTTRLTTGELFFGKFMAALARGLLQTLILLALSYAVFQMFTPLSFLSSVIIVLFYTAAAAALSLIIASIARSEEAANLIGIVFTMTLVMLGGTFFQAEKGTVFYNLGRASINTYANEALKKVIAEGGSLGDTVSALLIFAGVAAVTLIISRSIFKAVRGSR
jgi:ABC-2 type transport system permease protein